MNSLIKLAFVGSYKGDMLQYLSRILTLLNLKVIIIDGSNEQNLKCEIPNPFNDFVVNHRKVQYLFNQIEEAQLEEIHFGCYDIVLIDYGYNEALASHMLNSDMIFIICNLEIQNVYSLRDYLKKVNELKETSIKFIKIYRDLISCKISSKYIDRIIEIDKLGESLGEYSHYLTEDDYKYRILSQYEDVFKFKNLSSDYIQLFKDIMDELYDFKPKEIQLAIKEAQRGR